METRPFPFVATRLLPLFRTAQPVGTDTVNPGPDTTSAETGSGCVEPPQPARMKRSARGRPALATKRKDLPTMSKTKDMGSDAASTARPYIDRALHDDELRESVRNAYESARTIYNELIGKRGVTGVAARVATDKDIQDELRATIAELRRAADRVQAREQHKSRNSG